MPISANFHLSANTHAYDFNLTCVSVWAVFPMLTGKSSNFSRSISPVLIEISSSE